MATDSTALRGAADERRFDDLADRVPREDMELLDAGRLLRRSREADVGVILEDATAGTGEPDADRAFRLRVVECTEHVRRFAARRDADHDVAWPRERANLARENVFERPVVADGGQDRRVRRQRDRRPRLALDQEAAHELA